MATKKLLNKYVKKQQYKYKKYIGSQVAQAIVIEVFASIKKYLYEEGKQVHHKRFEETHTVSATSLTNGIKLDFKNNECIFCKFSKKEDCLYEAEIQAYKETKKKINKIKKTGR